MAASPKSHLELVEVFPEGLPVGAVDAAIVSGTLTCGEVDALLIPRRTVAHRQRTGQRLTREEPDRLARIARIGAQAEETLQASTWAHHCPRKP